MRLLPKRLSLHIQTESRKLKKSITKRYHEVSDSDDYYEEAITPKELPSLVDVEPPLDFVDNAGNFVQTMNIIKRESKRLSSASYSYFDDTNINKSFVDYSTNTNITNLTTTTTTTTTTTSFSSPTSPTSSSNNIASPSSETLEDIYSEYFFEKNAKDRAIFIACRIKKQLPSIFSGIQLIQSKELTEMNPEISPIDITKMIADRLFTLTYINEMMPSFSRERSKLLEKLDAKLSKQGDAKLSQKVGGKEAFFSFRYTLDHYFKHNILPSKKTLMVERARQVIQQCIESEEKLSERERECMYCFHRLMSGMSWDEDLMDPIILDLHD